MQMRQRLNDRRSWFLNQWLFKWHQLRNGVTEVDLFDGRMTHMGGREYWGSARDVYCDAITRGVRKEIVEQFAWVDQHVRAYNKTTADEAIDQCAGLLVAFVRVVRKAAVKKDRILRGNGRESPPEDDAGQWHGTSPEEILAQAEALKVSIPFATEVPNRFAPDRETDRLNDVWHKNQWWIGPLGFIVGALGLIVTFL